MRFDYGKFKKLYGKLCPCLVPSRETSVKDNMCPCTTFVEERKCRCGLFIEENKNETSDK